MKINLSKEITEPLEVYAAKNEITLEQAVERAVKTFAMSFDEKPEAIKEMSMSKLREAGMFYSTPSVQMGLIPHNAEYILQTIKILLNLNGLREDHHVLWALTLPLPKRAFLNDWLLIEEINKTLIEHKGDLKENDDRLDFCLCFATDVTGEVTDSKILKLCERMYRDCGFGKGDEEEQKKELAMVS